MKENTSLNNQLTVATTTQSLRKLDLKKAKVITMNGSNTTDVGRYDQCSCSGPSPAVCD